jgi:hypothetical protein
MCHNQLPLSNANNQTANLPEQCILAARSVIVQQIFDACDGKTVDFTIFWPGGCLILRQIGSMGLLGPFGFEYGLEFGQRN